MTYERFKELWWAGADLTFVRPRMLPLLIQAADGDMRAWDEVSKRLDEWDLKPTAKPKPRSDEERKAFITKMAVEEWGYPKGFVYDVDAKPLSFSEAVPAPRIDSEGAGGTKRPLGEENPVKGKETPRNELSDYKLLIRQLLHEKQAAVDELEALKAKEQAAMDAVAFNDPYPKESPLAGKWLVNGVLKDLTEADVQRFATNWLDSQDKVIFETLRDALEKARARIAELERELARYTKGDYQLP